MPIEKIPTATTRSPAPRRWKDARISASTEEKAELIEATAWASSFSYEQVKCLAGFTELYRVGSGTLLFDEGDKEAYFLLIAVGAVDIIKSDAQGDRKKISTLGAGKALGEMSLFDGEPRSAAAITTAESTLLVMTEENFKTLNATVPGVANVMLMKIARQMSQHLRLTSGRLVDGN